MTFLIATLMVAVSALADQGLPYFEGQRLVANNNHQEFASGFVRGYSAIPSSENGHLVTISLMARNLLFVVEDQEVIVSSQQTSLWLLLLPITPFVDEPSWVYAGSLVQRADELVLDPQEDIRFGVLADDIE